jgi:phosphopantothenoylcysteine synthetase/decarboxylase
MDKCVIIGGGTFNHVACHLSLATPAFGSTAKTLKTMLDGFGLEIENQLVLTKMADSSSKLVTNDDIDNLLFNLTLDHSVKAVIMNAALCDFSMENPSTQSRLSSSNDYTAELVGIRGKIIEDFKAARPDVFVVGFKTTHGDTAQQQAAKSFKLLHDSGIDLVLANDIKTRNNLLISKDLSIEQGTREELLVKLAIAVMEDIKEAQCYQYA